MKMIPVILLLSIAANFAGAQKLSDDAKYRILQSWTHGNAVLAELQQAQAEVCAKTPTCKAKFDEFQVVQKAYADLIAKESKAFPAGTTFNPDVVKMDVVVTVPKAEKKSEASK